MNYKRIMIFGRPGSGKSTFTLKLQQLTNLPIYHLDKYFFIANWAKRDNDEFMQLLNDIVTSDAWIIDGNCTRSLETRYKRADLCIYFNYPKLLCLWRMCKRLLQNREHIDDRANGCPEVIRWQILTYMWTFEKRVANIVINLKSNYPHVRFVEINSDNQIPFLIDMITKS